VNSLSGEQEVTIGIVTKQYMCVERWRKSAAPNFFHFSSEKRRKKSFASRTAKRQPLGAGAP
jgi:hypothetical protein